MKTEFLETQFPQSKIDVNSSRRKFQRSHIIKQSDSRNGILNFLTEPKQDQ